MYCEKTDRILEAKVLAYLDTYFNDRDCNGSLAFFSDKSSIIGTGRDEFGVHGQIKHLYERDIKQAPNKIEYNITYNHVNVINDNTGVVISKINIETFINNQLIKLNDLRSSFLLVKTKGKWLIEHHHISLPTSEHGEDEAYPLKELEERNIVLKRMVENKTNELKHTITELRNAQKTLEDLNKEKDKFFSIIAHDIRSPFNTLLGFSEMLAKKRHDIDKAQLDLIHQNLYKSTQNTYNLLENLLIWASSQMKKSQVNILTIYPGKLIPEIIKLFNAAINEKKINIICEIDVDIACLADKEIFKIIVRNLISNAIKFSFSGGNIYIFGKPIKNSVFKITIKDEGIGMSDDKLNNLFSIGKTFSNVGTNNEGGSGLGLIITKEMVEKINGRIYASSSPGLGTEFSFTLAIPT